MSRPACPGNRGAPAAVGAEDFGRCDQGHKGRSLWQFVPLGAAQDGARSRPCHAGGSQSLSESCHVEWLGFPGMILMDASGMKARALRARFSKSLANQRQRLSRAKVLSTTHRPGRALKPRAASERLTILIASGGMTFATALRNCGPGSRHRRKAWPEKDKGQTASRAKSCR